MVLVAHCISIEVIFINLYLIRLILWAHCWRCENYSSPTPASWPSRASSQSIGTLSFWQFWQLLHSWYVRKNIYMLSWGNILENTGRGGKFFRFWGNNLIFGPKWCDFHKFSLIFSKICPKIAIFSNILWKFLEILLFVSNFLRILCKNSSLKPKF